MNGLGQRSSRGARHRHPLRLLEMVEEHWWALGPQGRVITCAVYSFDGPGVDVPAGYSVDDFHGTQRKMT